MIRTEGLINVPDDTALDERFDEYPLCQQAVDAL
ncbi:hypothetical protein BH24ACT4_BH24ACT4_04470 [soil metagenome]